MRALLVSRGSFLRCWIKSGSPVSFRWYSQQKETLNFVPLFEKLKERCQQLENISGKLSARDSLILGVFRDVEPNMVELQSMLKDLEELKVMSELDQEFREIAQLDVESVETKVESLSHDISEKIIRLSQDHSDTYDQNDAVLEVQSGAGGQEAGLFAEGVFQMYLMYAQYLGFNTQVTEFQKLNVLKSSKFVYTTGIQKASASLSGVNVFRTFKFECGVHRVQRVPVTGTKSDRLQTSTCSVAVVPQPKHDDVEINPQDLKYEYIKASGPGGQSVNKTDSAVRLTHVPSGKVTECQEERSQIQNKAVALEKIRKILYREKFDSEMLSLNQSRKSQVGNMDRNEKIRTYNYTRNMISDHRIQMSKTVPSLNQFFLGQDNFSTLEEFRNALEENYKNEKLQALLNLDL